MEFVQCKLLRSSADVGVDTYMFEAPCNRIAPTLRLPQLAVGGEELDMELVLVGVIIPDEGRYIQRDDLNGQLRVVGPGDVELDMSQLRVLVEEMIELGEGHLCEWKVLVQFPLWIMTEDRSP